MKPRTRHTKLASRKRLKRYSGRDASRSPTTFSATKNTHTKGNNEQLRINMEYKSNCKKNTN